MRAEKDYTIIGFYNQPTVSSWYDNVGIISQRCMYEICGSLYGMSEEEIETSNLYKQSVLLFVDDIDYVKSIAEYIENKGFIVSYALMANDELPAMAKIILGIGIAITVILVLFSFIVINTSINNAVKERYREIGILKTIGVNEKTLFMMMYLELILLWVVIAIIEVILSVVVIYGISNISIFGNIKGIRISIIQLLMSTVFCLCIIVITTYATVKKTSKLKIVEVLRYE